MLALPAQREGLWLEPQAGLSDLPRAGIESADQAQETVGAGEARAAVRADGHQSGLVHGFHA